MTAPDAAQPITVQCLYFVRMYIGSNTDRISVAHGGLADSRNHSVIQSNPLGNSHPNSPSARRSQPRPTNPNTKDTKDTKVLSLTPGGRKSFPQHPSHLFLPTSPFFLLPSTDTSYLGMHTDSPFPKLLPPGKQHSNPHRRVYAQSVVGAVYRHQPLLQPLFSRYPPNYHVRFPYPS